MTALNTSGFGEAIRLLVFFAGLASIIIGTLSAITDTRLKKFILYSGLSQFGYVICGASQIMPHGNFYAMSFLTLYLLFSFVFWALYYDVYSLSLKNRNMTRVNLSNFYHPYDPMFIIIFLIFLAASNVPPLAGFAVKVNILSDLMYNKHFFYSYLILLTSVISTYFYIVTIKTTLFDVCD
jgi:NADH:ubiquinone oxidoreductase subunit 2 (subunit N)